MPQPLFGAGWSLCPHDWFLGGPCLWAQPQGPSLGLAGVERAEVQGAGFTHNAAQQTLAAVGSRGKAMDSEGGGNL